MPNWCYNSVTLYNEDKTEIDGLEQELSKEESQPLNYLRPNPSGDWEYDWSVSNWGTKWDISPHDWEREDDNTIVMSFDSAWSPPITIYEFLTENGWSVRAYYHEPGMAFVGRYEDGSDDYYEYDITDRESCENLPEDILDFSGIMDDVENYESEQEAEAYEETVTEWYSMDVNPEKVGFYEIKETENWPFTKFVHWNGKKWTDNGKKPKFQMHSWRGLKEEWKCETE